MQKNDQRIFKNWFNKNLVGLILVLVLFGFVSIPGTGISNGVVFAASNCTTSGPSGGTYTVTVCITAPTSTTLTGDVVVTGTAVVNGTNAGLQHMIFQLNGNYLLTDYQAPYTFTLPTSHFVDGNYTVSAFTLMRNSYLSTPATITVLFKNGITTPPVNHNTFTPALGTSPGNGNPLVVLAGGDGASGEANATLVTSLISSLNPNLFLYLGDVYEEGSSTEFYNWYGSNKNFGAFRSITDPTIGNHEYLADNNKDAAGYFDYWNNIPNYYSFTVGGWHFISLNANSQLGSSSSVQYQWLTKDLAANTAACTIAYWHQPIYNVGKEASQTSMIPTWSLLAQNKVDIVLNGHDHDYQRWVPLDGSGNPSPSGITEFVVGGTGHGIQTISKSDSRLAKKFDSSTKPAPFGVLRFMLSAGKATYNYINTSGSILDAGTINCNKASGGSPTATPTATITPGSSPTPSKTAVVNNTSTPTFTPGPTRTNTPTATATLANNGLTYTPAADAYVISTSATSNFGTATSLRADSSPVTVSYLKFNVQGLSGTPTSATLSIFFSSAATSGVQIKGVSDTTWGETAINYNNAPAVNSTAAGSVSSAAAGSWVNISINSLVKGNGLVSMAITTSGSTNIAMASRESGANSPQLIIH